MRMESPLNQRLRRSPPDVVYTPIDVTSLPFCSAGLITSQLVPAPSRRGLPMDILFAAITRSPHSRWAVRCPVSAFSRILISVPWLRSQRDNSRRSFSENPSPTRGFTKWVSSSSADSSKVAAIDGSPCSAYGRSEGCNLPSAKPDEMLSKSLVSAKAIVLLPVAFSPTSTVNRESTSIATDSNERKLAISTDCRRNGVNSPTNSVVDELLRLAKC